MTSSVVKPNKMTEIASLAALIATSIVEKQIEGSLIPPEHFRLLVRAAQILLDNEVSWPPSVDIVLSEVSKRTPLAGLAATS